MVLVVVGVFLVVVALVLLAQVEPPASKRLGSSIQMVLVAQSDPHASTRLGLSDGGCAHGHRDFVGKLNGDVDAGGGGKSQTS